MTFGARVKKNGPGQVQQSWRCDGEAGRGAPGSGLKRDVGTGNLCGLLWGVDSESSAAASRTPCVKPQLVPDASGRLPLLPLLPLRYVIYFFWPCWVFITAWVCSLVSQSGVALSCSVWACPGGFSCCSRQPEVSWVSVVVAPRLSRAQAQ